MVVIFQWEAGCPQCLTSSLCMAECFLSPLSQCDGRESHTLLVKCHLQDHACLGDNHVWGPWLALLLLLEFSFLTAAGVKYQGPGLGVHSKPQTETEHRSYELAHLEALAKPGGLSLLCSAQTWLLCVLHNTQAHKSPPKINIKKEKSYISSVCTCSRIIDTVALFFLRAVMLITSLNTVIKLYMLIKCVPLSRVHTAALGL